MNYEDFLLAKRHTIGDYGFDPVYMPTVAFDFQKAIIEKSVKKGRMAIFADTGLGKTIIQLSIAQNIIEKTNGKVLILTPLAVAFQFLKDADFIGIDDIEHSKDGNHNKKIVICNYERLHHFDSKDFEGVILDESSILKNFNGKIKGQINSFIKKVPYRFLSTATPSPNDFIELGTSSEALGYMGYMDMLSKFFKNNQNSSDSRNRNIGEKYYLKPHSEDDFFAWINQWAIMIKKPSDLGYSDEKYILPELIINHNIVTNRLSDNNILGLTDKKQAKTFSEIRLEQKQTVVERCEKSVELSKNKVSVYWCNRNDESETIAKMDSDSVEIRGGMSIDKKEDILVDFAEGNIERLVTKASMTGMGLNWQHCNHSTFFPTYSYEQYYQSIRRFWRFGQKSNVTIDIVISDGQTKVIEAIEQKTKKAIELYERLNNAVNMPYQHHVNEFDQKVKLPGFLK